MSTTSSSPKATIKVPFSLPIQRNFSFVGREEQLKQIHEHLSGPIEANPLHGDKSRVVVLHGLGGAGKTQLGAFYSHAHQGEFDAFLWVDGTDQFSTFLSFQEISHRLLDSFSGSGRDLEHSPLISRLHSIKEKVSSPKNTRSATEEALPKLTQAVIDLLQSSSETFTWLLVLDNVDNLTDFPLPTFLPDSKRGKIIITTRLTAVTRFGHPVEVGGIEASSGVKILLNNASLRADTVSGECSGDSACPQSLYWKLTPARPTRRPRSR